MVNGVSLFANSGDATIGTDTGQDLYTLSRLIINTDSREFSNIVFDYTSDNDTFEIYVRYFNGDSWTPFLITNDIAGTTLFGGLSVQKSESIVIRLEFMDSFLSAMHSAEIQIRRISFNNVISITNATGNFKEK